MVDLAWYELFPPRGCTLKDVTATLRPLAGRSRDRFWRKTPIVVFEMWIQKNSVRWLLGTDQRLSDSLPGQLTAQLPKLTLQAATKPRRPRLSAAMTVHAAGPSYRLRLDSAGAVATACLHIAVTLGKREAIVLQWVVGPNAARHRPPSQFSPGVALGLQPPAKPNPGQQRAWKAKAEEPLFAVQGRIGAVARPPSRANSLLKLTFDALALANSPDAKLRRGRFSLATTERLIAVSGSGRTWSSQLNAAELALLLAWPLDGVEAPGSSGALFGQVPAALLLPTSAHGAPGSERILGTALHPANREQLVTMPLASAAYHLHVTGPTGSGKSNLLAQMILADAVAGHSILVIEPKGDLVRDVLARLPAIHHPQVVVIEPSESGPVVGFNPLAGPPEEAERRADELLHLFRKVFGTAIGPRSADVLLHALITAARLPDGTLADIPVLLTNPSFRRRTVGQVNDALVLAPFWAQFDNFSDATREQVIAPVLNKLRAFLSRTAVRRLVGQAAPRFTLDELFTHRRIVLVNLNRGLIGPETARLLGGLLLSSGLWPAIQRRTMVPAARRHPVMITVDEFQDFVGALDFADVLATSRGLGAAWSLAHQHLGQLDQDLLAATLANARSRITFKPAQKDQAALAAVLGSAVTAGDLENLGAYEACARLLVDAAASPAFGVRTLALPKPSQNATMLARVSRERYGQHPAALDEALRIRWQGGDPEADGDIGVSRRRSS